MSFATVANAQNEPEYAYTNEATYGDVIQFSSYDISQGTETRVKNPSWTVSGYKIISLEKAPGTGEWENGMLTISSAGASDGPYFCYQDSGYEGYTHIINTVTIEDVPAGYYTVSQYIPYTTLGLEISVQNGEDAEPTVVGRTDAYTGSSAKGFVEVGSVYLSGNVTFTYTNTSVSAGTAVRIDETKLVKQTPEAKDEYAECVEDINENGDGASVWEATVKFDGDHSYTKLGVSAKLKDSELVANGEALEKNPDDFGQVIGIRGNSGKQAFNRA